METEASRIKKVIELLESSPGNLAITTDMESSQESVILTIAIRGLAAFEMTAPKNKYDGLRLLEILEHQNGGTVIDKRI
jgi:hypothetical protein